MSLGRGRNEVPKGRYEQHPHPVRSKVNLSTQIVAMPLFATFIFSHLLMSKVSLEHLRCEYQIDPLGIDVTLFGHGGGNFLVSVPHDVTVPQNAIVVSKEVNPHVLGVLQKTISDPRDSSQTLIFSTPINLNQLNFVEVEK